MKPVHIETLPNGTSFEMIYVEGGVFDMGSVYETAYKWEKPVHKVKLTDFWLCKYLVTQSLWKAIMGLENNPSFFKGDLRPVEMVSWDDCQDFLKKLNTLTHKTYRLPTEAEWEYAAKGGIIKENGLFSGSDKLEEVGWYNENSDGETKDVRLRSPNALGFYDMSGNVWEWCQDWYSHEYYEKCFDLELVKNPKGPENGDGRVIRGGSWHGSRQYCRISDRSTRLPGNQVINLGFRIALSY